jgi:hypothetical protein
VNTEIIVASCAVITLVLALAGWGLAQFATINQRLASGEAAFAALKVRCETIWMFQLRRGGYEAEEHEIAERNSPLRVLPEAMARLDPIKNELISLWKGAGFPPNGYQDDHEKAMHIEADATILIEQKYGRQLLDLICVPCHVSHGACLLAALAVAKQDPTIYSL